MSVEPVRPTPETQRAASATRRLWSAARLTSGVAFLTILLGVLSTKLLASVGGPAAVGTMGIFRNLSTIVTRTVALGLDTVILQRLSVARTDVERARIVRATVLVLAGQGTVIALATAAVLSLPPGWTTATVGVVPIVVAVLLAMALANLAVQLATVVLNGLGLLRAAVLVSGISSVVTLVTVVPLARVGDIGLAFNVGIGSLAGVALALGLLLRARAAETESTSWQHAAGAVLSHLRPSPYLLVHPVVMVGSLLLVQLRIKATLGVEALGSYAATTTVLDTVVILVMAPVRSFVIPSLGASADDAERAALFDATARMLVVSAAGAAWVLATAAPLVVSALFGDGFVSAADALAIGATSLVGQAMIHTCVGPILQRAEYRRFFLLDLLWAGILVGGVLLVTTFKPSLEAIMIVYTASYLVSGIVYRVATRDLGQAGHSLALLGATAGVGVLGVAVHALSTPAIRVIIGAAGLFGLAAVFVANLRNGSRGVS